MVAMPQIVSELSDEEVLASMGGEELYAVAHETSDRFNGLVLQRAIQIVARKSGLSVVSIAERCHMSKTAVYRWTGGKPVKQAAFERAMRQLALVLAIGE